MLFRFMQRKREPLLKMFSSTQVSTTPKRDVVVKSATAAGMGFAFYLIFRAWTNTEEVARLAKENSTILD